MYKFIYITLCLLFVLGCMENRHDKGRELCRLLFTSSSDDRLYDSIIHLADSLPKGERLEVLLEAIRSKCEVDDSTKKKAWFEEAEHIVPKGRKVEVRMERLVYLYLRNCEGKDTVILNKLRNDFRYLEKECRFTSRQWIWFLYHRVRINGETDLLSSWMDMNEALRLVHKVDDPKLYVRILESFSNVAFKGGDYERAMSLRKEAYLLREKERLPLDRKIYLNWCIGCLSYQEKYAETLEYLKMLRFENQKETNIETEKLTLKEIAKMFCLTNRFAEAAQVLQEARNMRGSLLYHADIDGRLANVYEKRKMIDSARFYYEKSVVQWQKYIGKQVLPVMIPVYSGYARILWGEGQTERALSLLEEALVKIPNYGREDRIVGDIHLLPYLDALSQLGNYYLKVGDIRSSLNLLIRRDSLKDRYVESESWYKKQQLAERYRNQELKTKLTLQGELLVSRKRGLITMYGLCVVLGGSVLMLWKLYRQKQRRLDDLYLKQKELERLESQILVEHNTDSPESVLFLRLEKMVLEQQLFRKPDLSLDDLCSVVGSNRSYVSACVNKEAGMNFSSWINKIRISYVLQEIKKGKYDLIELYVLAGFASPTSFYRNFKQLTQMTPKQYLEREKRKIY